MLSHRLRILIAPSGFKESLGSEEVAQCIEDGVRRVLPEPAAYIHKVPLHDGGEGFCRALVSAYGGELREMTVTGPIGEPVPSHFGLIGEDTAVLDMAAAAGLRLVPTDCRDPTVTSTFGVGELMAAALDHGEEKKKRVTKIVIGCGDSGTSDGGAGMLQALGFRLLDSHGQELPRASGGSSLVDLHSIDTSSIHPRLRDGKVKIEAVCNIKNVLCGPQGVARVYGPQKGATPQQVELLSSALDRFSSAAGHLLGQEDIGSRPGSGASGGLGAGLMLLGGKLRPRSEAADEYFGLGKLFGSGGGKNNSEEEEEEAQWDLVVTGEGSLDHQSAKGKMTIEMAKRARQAGVPVVVLAGTIGQGAEALYDLGIAAYTSILDGPQSLAEAIGDADRLVRDAAEKSIRMITMGMALGAMGSRSPSPPPAQQPPVPACPMIKPLVTSKTMPSLEQVPSMIRIAGMTN